MFENCFITKMEKVPSHQMNNSKIETDCISAVSDSSGQIKRTLKMRTNPKRRTTPDSKMKVTP